MWKISNVGRTSILQTHLRKMDRHRANRRRNHNQWQDQNLLWIIGSFPWMVFWFILECFPFNNDTLWLLVGLMVVVDLYMQYNVFHSSKLKTTLYHAMIGAFLLFPLVKLMILDIKENPINTINISQQQINYNENWGKLLTSTLKKCKKKKN